MWRPVAQAAGVAPGRWRSRWAREIASTTWAPRRCWPAAALPAPLHVTRSSPRVPAIAALGSCRCAAAAASDNDDPYQVLGVQRDASADDIKAAYRRLALKWHPDRNPQNQAAAEAEFKRVSKAYATLSDPAQRAQFDRFGGAGFRSEPGMQAPQGRAFTEAEAEEIFKYVFGSRPLDEILREFHHLMEQEQRRMELQARDLRAQVLQLRREANMLNMQALREPNRQKKEQLVRMAVERMQQAHRVEQEYALSQVHIIQEQTKARWFASELRREMHRRDPLNRVKNQLRFGVSLGAALGCYLMGQTTLLGALVVYLITSFSFRVASAILRRMYH